MEGQAMNHRLNVLGWDDGKDPEEDPANHFSSFHHSKYQEAYLDFLQRMSYGPTQIVLVDLDNHSDTVIVDDSRREVE